MEIPLQVAVMGCVVNGPGEARDADIGIAAGNKRGHLFVRGTNVAVVPEDEMVDTLVEWATFIHEHGVDEAMDKADLTAAKEAAEADRAMLLEEQGDDANASEQVVDLIRKHREVLNPVWPHDRGYGTAGIVVPVTACQFERAWSVPQRRSRSPTPG